MYDIDGNAIFPLPGFAGFIHWSDFIHDWLVSCDWFLPSQVAVYDDLLFVNVIECYFIYIPIEWLTFWKVIRLTNRQLSFYPDPQDKIPQANDVKYMLAPMNL